MNNPLRFLTVACFLALTGLLAPSAPAATVSAINKDNSRVILKLTQAELAAVEDGDAVLIEVEARPLFVVAGTLTKVNPLKKTVVVVLEQVDSRLAPKQAVRFLSLFFNPLLSPVLSSYSQYHQYSRSSAEAGFGYAYDKQMEKSGKDSRSKVTLTGTEFVAEGYALISPRFFGAGFGYRRFEGDLAVSINGEDGKAEVTINQIRPGAWIEVQEGWVIGLRYDYTLLDETYKNGGPSFSYDLEELVLGVTHHSSDFEYSFTYKDKAHYTAIDTQTDSGGQSTKVESTLKTPAVLDLSFRSVSSPVFGWGLGLGYIFYERELRKGDELRTEPGVAELLRSHLTLEWRLDDGSKLDTVLSYDGGRDSNRIYGENTANKAGLDISYAQPAYEHYMFGGTIGLQDGAIALDDEETDPVSGDAIKNTREVQTVAVNLLLFARLELDLLAKGRKR